MTTKITGHTSICMIVGDPIKFSRSPMMHNAAYEAVGIDDKFVFVCCEVGENDTASIANFIRVMGIRGVSCANPHNTRIIEYLDEVDPIAEAIGSVNTVVNEQGRLVGYNTDWIGAITALEQVCDLKGKNVAVLGAGGAARAIAFGLRERGAEIAIFGRSIEKASALAKTTDGAAYTFDEIAKVADFDAIINATPIGKAPFENTSLVPIDYLNADQVVMDAVYVPLKTQLLVDAERVGARIVPGMEMLLLQGVAQFEKYTCHTAPVEIMRQGLLRSLEGSA
jgi:shikimate dehydrogenase